MVAHHLCTWSAIAVMAARQEQMGRVPAAAAVTVMMAVVLLKPARLQSSATDEGGEGNTAEAGQEQRQGDDVFSLVHGNQEAARGAAAAQAA
jgi:hypothetical protein